METRNAVRAVVIDSNLNTAILSVNNGQYYKIPGGTIEEGEDEGLALKRELKEEAGCAARIINKIGEFEFTGPLKKRTYHSTCYLTRLEGKTGNPEFDAWEKDHNFKLIWVNLDKALKIFDNCHPQEPFEKTIHERDYRFLRKAKEMLDAMS